MLASTLAIQSALDAEATLADLATIAAGGRLTVFAMWWVYFAKGGRTPPLTSLRAAATWGYGHYVVFGSAAAVGAGLAVNVDTAVHTAHLGERAAGLAFTVPVALFLLTVWLLHLRSRYMAGWRRALMPVAALAVVAAALTPQPVLVTGLLMAALVVVGLVASRAAQAPGSPRPAI